MDINHLFTDEGLRAFTEARRDQHLADAREYGQLADIVRRRLEQTPVEGDRAFSAKRRARKVARQLRAMERASEKAASRSEALYATHRYQVLELPERGRQAELRKSEKANRQLTTAYASHLEKSLGKSASTLTPPRPESAPVEPERVTQRRTAGQPKSIVDFFGTEQAG